MKVYKDTLNRVSLSGPTHFSRVLDKAMGYAVSEKR